jgi:hypothetical protein
MGILDDAIREHLELKRKHGVPEEEVERQQEEALGPARRDVAQQPEEAETAAEGADDTSLFDGEGDAAVAEAPAIAHGETTIAEPPVAEQPAEREKPPGPPSEQPLAAAEPTVAQAPPAEARPAEPFSPEPLSEEPPPEPFFEEPPEPEPPVADHTGLEPPPDDDESAAGALRPEPSAAEPPEPAAAEPPEPAAVEAPPEPDPHAALGDTEPHGFPALDDDDLAEDDAVDDDSPDDPLPAADVEDEDEDRDVLEDTPDFLQETPEHDRLWFEQKPPRDFDFD